MLIKKNKILVLGQTPPPYGGQALMLKILLEGEYENAELFHVRLEFSKDFGDMGSFRLYKFWGLIKAIVLTWVYRFYYHIDILYYGPAGPNILAVYRDMFLLLPIRFLFKKTILHTHAGGSSRLYKNLNIVSKYFYRIAFFKPDIIISLTEFSHGDDVVLLAKNKFVVPNGIKDEYSLIESNYVKNNGVQKKILYVGALYEERGIIELVEAAKLLKQKKIEFCVQLVGMFISFEFKALIFELIKNYNLENNIVFLGTKINEDKWKIYQDADIFCFPTFVPSETFGIVLVESMQFKIPIIASRWNGIPFVVTDGYDGLLVNPKDINDLADKMEILIRDNSLRKKLGENGRRKYLSNYSINKFYNNMDSVFSKL